MDKHLIRWYNPHSPTLNRSHQLIFNMAETPASTPSDIVTFLRRRDYELIRELGHGACGRTVLLKDDVIDERFVCKKFVPYSEQHREDLFANFVREIKLLHQLHHVNVVRVFNYYIYPDQFTGYILMEFIDGTDVQKYLAANPERTTDLFLQAISGFGYLEKCRILHRDIRPFNLMVTSDGILKLIDLGFGKRVRDSNDFEKSISLNWWCEVPDEFVDHRYDYATEVYFVGKLFEKIIRENNVAEFQYLTMLRQMCERDPRRRIASFSAVAQNVRTDQFSEISFSDADLVAYRMFANEVCEHLARIENGTRYKDDLARVQRELNDAYRTFMLEEFVPESVMVLNCLLDGMYYFKRGGFPVSAVRQFLVLLKSATAEQGRIILANLHTRLDRIVRYSPEAPTGDDVPF